ncbi:MAG TPA: hypothetical protein VM054_00070 [bacterium]|nr:hypothetical protein [bacterium]
MRRYFLFALVAALAIVFAGCGEAVKYEKPEALVDAFVAALAAEKPVEALAPLFTDAKMADEVVALLDKGLTIEGAYTITDGVVTWEKAVYMEAEAEFTFTLNVAATEDGGWLCTGYEAVETVVPVDEEAVLNELMASYTVQVKALGEKFKVTGNIQPYIAFLDGAVTGINSWAQSGEDTKAWENEAFRADLEKLILTFQIAEMGEVDVLWSMDFPMADYVAPAVEPVVEPAPEPVVE